MVIKEQFSDAAYEIKQLDLKFNWVICLLWQICFLNPPKGIIREKKQTRH
jgi:hypothetical protein